MRSHVGVRICGVFNIIAGGAGGFIGLLLQMFGPSIIASMLLLAGVLSAVSGVCLLFFPQRTRSVALGLLALAVVLSLMFSMFIVLELGLEVALDPRDEEILMFIWLPGLVTLLAIAELFYLWRRRSAK